MAAAVGLARAVGLVRAGVGEMAPVERVTAAAVARAMAVEDQMAEAKSPDHRMRRSSPLVVEGRVRVVEEEMAGGGGGGEWAGGSGGSSGPAVSSASTRSPCRSSMLECASSSPWWIQWRGRAGEDGGGAGGVGKGEDRPEPLHMRNSPAAIMMDCTILNWTAWMRKDAACPSNRKAPVKTGKACTVLQMGSECLSDVAPAACVVSMCVHA